MVFAECPSSWLISPFCRLYGDRFGSSDSPTPPSMSFASLLTSVAGSARLVLLSPMCAAAWATTVSAAPFSGAPPMLSVAIYVDSCCVSSVMFAITRWWCGGATVSVGAFVSAAGSVCCRFGIPVWGHASDVLLQLWLLGLCFHEIGAGLRVVGIWVWYRCCGRVLDACLIGGGWCVGCCICLRWIWLVVVLPIAVRRLSRLLCVLIVLVVVLGLLARAGDIEVFGHRAEVSSSLLVAFDFLFAVPD